MEKMKEIIVLAHIDELDKVLEFIEEQLETIDCSPKTLCSINIAVEEIFVNIAHYAYRPQIGEATIRCVISEQEPQSVTIQFIDSGVQYDPLQRDDPDITLSAEQREIGGLGVYMVKKSMDSIAYEYTDGKNILTIMKKI